MIQHLQEYKQNLNDEFEAMECDDELTARDMSTVMALGKSPTENRAQVPTTPPTTYPASTTAPTTTHAAIPSATPVVTPVADHIATLATNPATLPASVCTNSPGCYGFFE